MNFRMMNLEDDTTEPNSFERMPKKRRLDDEGRGRKPRDTRRESHRIPLQKTRMAESLTRGAAERLGIRF